MFAGLTYQLRTFGCQMNKHDSERIAGMLEAQGALMVSEAADADIIVYMTCCVREAADMRAFGQIASIKNLPASDGSKRRRIIAVGGCIGQRDGEKLAQAFGHIDVVFGTHNLAHAPSLIAAALESTTENGAQVEVLDNEQVRLREDSDAGSKLDIAPATSLPAHREQSWHAWLPIMTGCDNFCSYCIVPFVRGREKSRKRDDILAELEQLQKDGVREVTLLGQNVNSYGRDLHGKPQFAEMLRDVAASGIERIRFATSHPKDLSDDTIAAFAELPAVMPALHLPVQSGSDTVLKAMNRHYTAEHYLELIHKVRKAAQASGKGEIAFSTDIIVGFPGETAADFEATLELARAVGYSQAFTFIYSKRGGTPAAKMEATTPSEVIQERFDELVALVQESAFERNQIDTNTTVEVLFEGTSKRNEAMLVGKSPKNQTVHVPLPAKASVSEFAGNILPVHIHEARTWYLKGELL
ncbi:MAG: tRNA (N6-isopentenyl adenosine(37)-C2)-methylthiotransferase MiaB [Coriobacteriales bacterium]|nr:tRNA (N6-isopentenyl adenosine(37)-C2)-methylthiotransferase MiaB [Coriobacteriales bacterium]